MTFIGGQQDGQKVDTLAEDGARRRAVALARAREKSLASRRSHQPTLKRLRADGRGPSHSKPWHAEVIRRMLMGQSLKQISEEIGKAYVTIKQLTRTTLFRKTLEDTTNAIRERNIDKMVNDPVSKRLLKEGERSLDVLLELRDSSDDENVRRLSAREILERHQKLTEKTRDMGGTQLPQGTIEALSVAIKEVMVYRESQATVKVATGNSPPTSEPATDAKRRL